MITNSLIRIQNELTGLGYTTRTFGSPQGEVVAFVYKVESGTHAGRELELGLSYDSGGEYPEYPPHWIHLSEPIDDGRGGVIEPYTDPGGKSWFALSRPPGDWWDRLPTKHMKYFITEHLRGFWNGI